MPRGHVAEWGYISTTLDLSTRWERSASRPARFIPWESAPPPSIHCLGGLGGEAGLDAVEKERTLLGIEPRPLQPLATPTELSRLPFNIQPHTS
jgi:hypothetical protein